MSAARPQGVTTVDIHCHVMTHVSPSLYVDGTAKPAHEHDHASAGMTGMVLGITVSPREGNVGRSFSSAERG